MLFIFPPRTPRKPYRLLEGLLRFPLYIHIYIYMYVRVRSLTPPGLEKKNIYRYLFLFFRSPIGPYLRVSPPIGPLVKGTYPPPTPPPLIFNLC